MQQYDEDEMHNWEMDHAWDEYTYDQDEYTYEEAEQLEAEAAAPPPASVTDAVLKHPDLEVPSRVFERRIENADTGYGRELMMYATDREDWDRLDDHSKQMSVSYANRMWTKGNMDGRWQGKDGETEEKQFVRRVIKSNKRTKAVAVEPMEDDLELSSSSEEEQPAPAVIDLVSSSEEEEIPVRRSTRARKAVSFEDKLYSGFNMQA